MKPTSTFKEGDDAMYCSSWSAPSKLEPKWLRTLSLFLFLFLFSLSLFRSLSLSLFVSLFLLDAE